MYIQRRFPSGKLIASSHWCCIFEFIPSASKDIITSAVFSAGWSFVSHNFTLPVEPLGLEFGSCDVEQQYKSYSKKNAVKIKQKVIKIATIKCGMTLVTHRSSTERTALIIQMEITTATSVSHVRLWVTSSWYPRWKWTAKNLSTNDGKNTKKRGFR